MLKKTNPTNNPFKIRLNDKSIIQDSSKEHKYTLNTIDTNKIDNI